MLYFATAGVWITLYQVLLVYHIPEPSIPKMFRKYRETTKKSSGDGKAEMHVEQ